MNQQVFGPAVNVLRWLEESKSTTSALVAIEGVPFPVRVCLVVFPQGRQPVYSIHMYLVTTNRFIEYCTTLYLAMPYGQGFDCIEVMEQVLSSPQFSEQLAHPFRSAAQHHGMLDH